MDRPSRNAIVTAREIIKQWDAIKQAGAKLTREMAGGDPFGPSLGDHKDGEAHVERELALLIDNHMNQELDAPPVGTHVVVQMSPTKVVSGTVDRHSDTNQKMFWLKVDKLNGEPTTEYTRPVCVHSKNIIEERGHK